MISRLQICLFLGAVMLLTTLASPVFAQDFERMRRELRQQQDNTNREIQTLQQLITQYEQQIRETGEEYNTLYREFQELEREIALRDAVIRSLQTQGRQIAEEISVLQREYNQNRNELEHLIETYQESLRYLYKHGRVPELAYLFTSGSFNQMLIRSYYLRRFEDQRTRQAQAIERKQEELRLKEEELTLAREDVERNLEDTRAARDGLAETRQRQDRNIARLRQDRRQMQEKLAESRRAVEELNEVLNRTLAEIERVQREEQERIRQLEAERLRRLAEAQRIQDATERERAIARYSEPVTRSSFVMSQEDIARIELTFVRNKGNMNWPVNGVITQGFGYRVHPVYRTRLPSPGIEISTDARSPVQAVHDGQVTAILRGLTEYGDLVIIAHGNEYRTVYGNLSEIHVTQHMVVREGDIIGLSGDQSTVRGNSLFFMVRGRGADNNLNPTEWIRPQHTSARTR